MKKQLMQLTREKNTKAPVIQLLLILLSCIFTAVIQGNGFFEDSHYSKVLMLSCIFFAYFILLFYLKITGRLRQENTAVTMILFLGVLIRCSYVLLSGLYERQHDAGAYTGMGTDFANPGHIGYIEYIYKFGKLPDFNPYQLFSYYHPPLHYLLSALWLKLNILLGAAEDFAFENLQILPLLYSCLFMAVACRILKTLGIRGQGLYIGLSFAVFHPAAIILSGSVNNDMLSLLFMCLTILYTLKFIQEKNLKNLIKPALSIGFGMITKINSAVMALPVGLIFLLHFLSVLQRKKKSEILAWVKNYCIFALVVMPIGLSWIVRNLIRFGEKPGISSPTEISSMYAGNYSLLSHIGIPSLSALRIDFPFHPINADACHNTWVIMLHTSLFTEEYPTNLSDILLVLCQSAYVLAIVLSIVTAVLLFAVLLNQVLLKEERIFLLSGYLVMIGAFAAFAVLYPYTCSSDFRYAAICLVYIAIALGLGNKYYLEHHFRPVSAAMHIINGGILSFLLLCNLIYIFWDRW